MKSASGSSTTYDVAFVGTGISSTFTLVEFLARLEQQKAGFTKVLMIDKDADFFKGVPYGNRSGDLGLIISRLADFLPEAHLGEFGDWLAANRERAFERFFAMGGDFEESWRSNHWPDVEAGEIAELYLPRYVFGLYFEHIAQRAIERAEQQGVASCETVVGEVVDLDRADGGFTVVTRDPSGREAGFQAQRVVLGIGSAPSRRVLESQAGTLPTAPGCALIEDPFEPGIADMLDRIRVAVDRWRGANGSDASGRVLIIGSNAGALDVIFNLMNDPTIAGAIGRIDVVSMSGRFPELFDTRPARSRSGFLPRALTELATRESILADDILEAVRRDIDTARRDGLTITDTFSDVSGGFTALMDRLPPQEMMRFACDTGPRIGALQRKAGQEYWGVTDGLMRDGKLAITQSRFPADAGASGQEDLLAIVNCSGSERLSSAELNSTLIRNLLGQGWLRATGSDFGICVNEDLETDTPGVYVIGPMLTGNVVRGYPAWNLEHCARIAMFAGQLAEHLVERAFAEVAS